jgi:Fur family ferric uptake transcriptional regulator
VTIVPTERETAWEQRFADEGYRMTAPRRAIIEVLSRATTPLAPQEVLERAQAIHRNLGLVTVYRLLNLLVDLKLVRRVHFEHGCHGYLPASPGHHHTIVCQCCGQAAEFPGDRDVEQLAARVERWTGYRIQDHLLQFYGLCPGCHTAG